MVELSEIHHEFGLYAHGNQPVHHILYLFAMLGEQNATSHYVRYSLEHFYGAYC